MTNDDRFCLECGYNLHGLTGPRCPECGKPFGSNHGWTASATPQNGLASLGLALSPLACAFVASAIGSPLLVLAAGVLALALWSKLLWAYARSEHDPTQLTGVLALGIASMGLFGFAVIAVVLLYRVWSA